MKKENIVDRLAQAFGYVRKGFENATGSGAAFLYDMFKTKRSQSKMLDEYRSWVYACVKARAEDVSEMKLHLYKTQGDEVKEITDHEVLSLLRSVNGSMTWRDLIEATQTYIDLSGEAFWWLTRAGAGNNIVGIWPLRPDLMRVNIGDDMRVTGYKYCVNAKEISIAKEDIIHFKNFNPRDPFRGLSVISALEYTITNDDNAERYNMKFFANNAAPSFSLTTPNRLGEDLRKRLKSEIDNEFRGTDKAHKFMILEGGLAITPFSISQRDMEFIAGQNFNRDKILGLFKTPKSVLGMTEGVTVSNTEATDLIFSKRVVRPAMRKIVDTLNEMLLSNYKDDALFFDFDDPVPQDVVKKGEQQKAMFSMGALTPNEIREENGYSPVTGLDDYYLPVSVLPVSQDFNSEEDQAAVKGPRGDYKRKRIPKAPAKRFEAYVMDKLSSKVLKEIMPEMVQYFKQLDAQRTKDAEAAAKKEKGES